MRAMQLDGPGQPLRMVMRNLPSPDSKQILIEVSACGVCRTDLHVADGDICGPLPIVPGHEIVGRIIARGTGVTRFDMGQRVGVPWLGTTCGLCRYCLAGQENLCDAATFTGFTTDGGYASHVLAAADYCFALPDRFDDTSAAPLLCAGLIGFRALSMAGDAQLIGFYGFGASAHILAQIAVAQGKEIHAFTRPGDVASQCLARELGCAWAGGSDERPVAELDAAIIFAPVGALLPTALAAIRKGGTVVCAGIHMSEIPAFRYELLWGERVVRSVANLTRADGEAFFATIADIPIITRVEQFALADANTALDRLRQGRISGAAVLVP